MAQASLTHNPPSSAHVFLIPGHLPVSTTYLSALVTQFTHVTPTTSSRPSTITNTNSKVLTSSRRWHHSAHSKEDTLFPVTHKLNVHNARNPFSLTHEALYSVSCLFLQIHSFLVTRQPYTPTTLKKTSLSCLHPVAMRTH